MITDLQPHIRCSRENVAKYAILPGDPGRIEKIKKYLGDAVDVAYNREFRTAIGYYKGVKVMAVSTGIGGASTCIAVEELKNIGVDTLIRIGSCGALQDNIKLGDLIIANGAVRNDGTSEAYVEKGYPAIPDTDILVNLIQTAKELEYQYHCGRVRSHDSFYTDQEAAIDHYWSERGILGADMETSALFVIGGLRNLRTASILNVVVQKDGKLDEGINDYVDGESETSKGEVREILTVLETIVKLDKER